MQVNSTQDWLTKYKRRVVAKSINAVPPPKSRQTNAIFLSATANNATQYERFVAPFQAAGGGSIGGATYSSDCCLANGASGAFGAFSVVTDRGVVPYNGRSVQPMSK